MSSPGSRAVAPPPDPGLLSLYDAALPQVYGYLLARCGQRALAEDLTAETFLAAVGRRPTAAADRRVRLADRHRPAQAGRPLAAAGEREERSLAPGRGRRGPTTPGTSHLDALRGAGGARRARRPRTAPS